MSGWRNRVLTLGKNLRLFSLIAFAILLVIPAASYAGTLFGNHSLFPGVHPVAGQGTSNIVGIDCGYGSQVETAGAMFPTSVTTPAPYVTSDFDGTLDTSCPATYLADTDGVLHPLVSDNPNAAVTSGVGGGLTIDVVTELIAGQTMNGFDISLHFNTKQLKAVGFDQSGLLFGGAPVLPSPAFVLTLAKAIDNSGGSARLAQVVVGLTPNPSGTVELFRVRFDVVGSAIAPISCPMGAPNPSAGICIFDDVLTSPASISHTTQSLATLDTQSIYNTLNAGATLGFVDNWTFSPNPEVLGSSLTFSAAPAFCPGCRAPFTYNWDFSSSDAPTYVPKISMTGQSVMVTAPPPVINRVTLTVTDAVPHSFAITRILPLALVASPANPSLSVGVAGPAGGFTAKWLGGVVTTTAGYTGSWRFCPGNTLTTTVCSSPAPGISQLPTMVTQIATVASETFHFAGVYNDTVQIRSATSTEQQLGFASDNIIAIFLTTVTGTPQAYTVTVTANPTAPTVGQSVTFGATVAYAGTYPTGFQSSTFSYKFDFGDGSTPFMVTGGTSITASHAFSSAGLFTVQVTAQETGISAVTKIQEVGGLGITVSPAITPLCSTTGSCDFTVSPTSPVVGSSATFTATVAGGTAPYSFAWTFGDGGTGTGNPVSHIYSVKGTYTVALTLTDSSTPTAQTFKVSHAVTVTPIALAVSISGPTTGTVGTAVTFTATGTGGTAPYTFAWTATGGSPSSGTSSSFTTTYSAKGTYAISVIATDSNAKTATASASITISPLTLTVSVNGPTTGTVGTAVTFTAVSSGGTTPYTFAWTASGGNPSSGTGSSLTTTYSAKGTYSVSVVVTDTNAKTASASASITISPLALAVAIGGPTTGTVGTAVAFTATGSGGTTPYTFAWTATGGSPASGTGPSLSTTYNVKGSYTVSVIITDTNAHTATASTPITISPLTLAVIISGPTTGGVGTPVTFTATATGGTSPYTFSWTATGGSPSSGTGSSFTTTYNTANTYTVSVTATDTNAKTATASATIIISPGALGVTISGPSTGTVGTAVTFTATGSGGTTPYTFAWTATGGSPATGSTASFTTTYNTKGSYTVSVTITDARAATSSASASITISPLSLVVTISGPITGTVGTPVTFTATGSGGTSPYSFAWTATSGNPSSGSTASFTTMYSVKGSYTVRVTITDTNAKTATASATITINPLTLAITINGPTTGTVGTSVTFTAAGSGGTSPYTFAWTATGTPSSGTGASFATTYSTKGTFTVSATATDSNAKTATASATITINPLTLAVTMSGPTSGGVSSSLTFTATGTGGTTPYTFAWIATGGSPSSGSGSSFTTMYANTGTFTVSVTITDANAKTATSSQQIVISTAFAVSIAGPTTGTVGTPVMFTSTVTGGTSPFTYSWTGTGGSPPSSTSSSFTTTYNVKGTYTISLTVTDTSAATVTATASITISPLTLAVTINGPAAGTVGSPLSFIGYPTGGTSPYGFSWTATGGSPSTGPGSSFMTTYNVKGTYTVGLTVTDANGKTASATQTITISPLTLKDDFTFSPSSPTIGQSVTFTPIVSGGTTPYSYTWSFGDGTSSTSASPSHIYTTAGAFTVMLSVTDANGVLATATHSVTVSAVTTVGDFSISVNPGHVSLVTGGARNVTVVVHSVNFAGTVTLSVTITPAVGASATLSKTTLTLAVNTTEISKLRLTALVPGSYTVTVTATSGSLSHSDTVALTVAGFTLTAAPSSLTVHPGSSGTISIALESQGFFGPVHLTARINPATDGGPSLSFSSANILLSNDGTGSASLQVSSDEHTVLGSYTITISASGHGLVRSSTVHLVLADPTALPHHHHHHHHHQD